MWDARRIEQQERKSLLASQNLEIEKDIEKAVDLMMDANSPAIIKRIKESVCKLGDKKRVLEETSSKQAYL